MKNTFASCILLFITLTLSAQEPSKQVMEGRAKEMIRVIGLTDKDEYRKFIRENYSQALIDKPMRKTVKGSDDESSTDTKEASNLEGKVSLYERLHEDVGNGKITLLKPDSDKLEVHVTSEEGAKLKFILTFARQQPYLIDGLMVEMTRDR